MILTDRIKKHVYHVVILKRCVKPWWSVRLSHTFKLNPSLVTDALLETRDINILFRAIAFLKIINQIYNVYS